MGCGTGWFTVPLAERARSVSGLDMSPMMLAKTRGKFVGRGLGVGLREGDMADLPFPDGSFDVVQHAGTHARAASGQAAGVP